MGIHDIIRGKREWRAHRARVDALPADYRIVYDEVQKYLRRLWPMQVAEGGPLADLLEFLEAGAASGTPVTDHVGPDVAAFADGLMGDTPTYMETYRSEHGTESGL